MKRGKATKSDALSSSSSLDLAEALLKSSSGSSDTTSRSLEVYEYDPKNRPPVSYSSLILEALQSSPDGQLVLSEIYAYIEEHYPYFRTASKGWKNSIRHNLSLNKSFIKTRQNDTSLKKKGSFWKVDGKSPFGSQLRTLNTLKSSSKGYLSVQNGKIIKSFNAPVSRSYFPPTLSIRTKGKLPKILPRPCNSFDIDSSDTSLGNYVPKAVGMNEDFAKSSSPLLLGPTPIHWLTNFLTSDQSFSKEDPSNYQFKNDVFLGAGTPKQNTALDIDSPIASLKNSSNVKPSLSNHRIEPIFGDYISIEDLV